MKRKNRESLRIALSEFRQAYRIFHCDVQRTQYNERLGTDGPTSDTLHSYSDWMIALDVLEETVERVLEDER